MTTTSNAAVHREDAPNTRGGVGDLGRASRPARGGETKAFYKTTEFVVFIVATIAVLVASVLVKAADGHGDYFAADKAWLYVWGKVTYHDGFNRGRFIAFCHRYNLYGATEYGIPARNGRYHEHGNRTDES